MHTCIKQQQVIRLVQRDQAEMKTGWRQKDEQHMKNYEEKLGFARLHDYERKLSAYISLWLSMEEISKVKTTFSILYHYLSSWEWQLIFEFQNYKTAWKCLYNTCLRVLYNLCKRSDLLSCNLYKCGVLLPGNNRTVKERALFVSLSCVYILQRPGTKGKEILKMPSILTYECICFLVWGIAEY